MPARGLTYLRGKGTMAMTWNDIAELYPEFVAWAVQAGGPLLTGEVREEDYSRLKAAYETRGDQ